MIPLRHGAFLPPFHPMNENPAACIDRDLELMQWLDRLGFHEAWIGEHHSAGWELISSPELFIAVAAERTAHPVRHRRDFVALPQPADDGEPHHPARPPHPRPRHVRRRSRLLASDALMLGIDPNTQRDRMAEALDVILRFFRGEVVTEKTDWYSFVNARAHILPIHAASRGRGGQRRHAVRRPAGRQIRPQHDLRRRDQSVRLRRARGELEDRQRHRRRARPHDGPVAAATGRADAHRRDPRSGVRELKFGFERYLGYLNNNQPRFIVPPGQDAAEWFVENKFGVIGTPDDAIALIERLRASRATSACSCTRRTTGRISSRPSDPMNCTSAT